MKTKESSRPSHFFGLLLSLTAAVLALSLTVSCAARKKTAATSAGKPEMTASSASGKTDKDTPQEMIPFVVVEEMPLFPGGDSMLLDFIAHNTKYPEAAKQKKIEGKVILRFCVTEKGTVDKISVLRSADPELDAEAIRVAGTLPKFIPGRQGGKDVPVWYMIPVTFALK